MNRYSKRGIILLCSLAYFTSYFARKDFAAVSAGILESGFLGINGKEIAGLIGTYVCHVRSRTNHKRYPWR